jgi:hypothetical protein
MGPLPLTCRAAVAASDSKLLALPSDRFPGPSSARALPADSDLPPPPGPSRAETTNRSRNPRDDEALVLALAQSTERSTLLLSRSRAQLAPPLPSQGSLPARWNEQAGGSRPRCPLPRLALAEHPQYPSTAISPNAADAGDSDAMTHSLSLSLSLSCSLSLALSLSLSPSLSLSLPFSHTQVTDAGDATTRMDIERNTHAAPWALGTAVSPPPPHPACLSSGLPAHSY